MIKKKIYFNSNFLPIFEFIFRFSSFRLGLVHVYILSKDRRKIFYSGGGGGLSKNVGLKWSQENSIWTRK